MMNPQLPEHRVYSEQEEAYFMKFDKEIEAYLANIKKKIDEDAPSRSKILQQVQELSQRIYPKEKPLVKLFGSLTTCLALESSDMDIAI